MRNVLSLHPIPSQTGGNPWQSQDPRTHRQSSPAALGPQETVQLVKQRAQKDLNVQRETARRAFLHQQGEFIAATRQHEVAARQKLVSALARKMKRTIITCRCKFGNSNMMQMRDFPKDKRNCHRDSLKKQIKLLDTRRMEAKRTST